jgi:hypothetical protein
MFFNRDSPYCGEETPMPSSERRNPASPHALTVFEVRELRAGTLLLVCRMNDYHIDRDSRKPLETRVDSITPVTFMGVVARPTTHFDAGTGSWVVFDRYLEFDMASHKEVGRRWPRANWHAYEPSALGLTMAANWSPGGGVPGWNDHTCVIRPEHATAFRSEYPRRVRSR